MKTVINFILVSVAVLITASMFAQTAPDESVPLDPKVIYGKLPNGMTYYIRHNEKPKERAEYYIVHNVGAILEDDDQNGLAHFTEHMAFNGTANFPDKGILNFMEKNGVAFGHNVNAFTAQDVTAYMLSKVPTTREGIIDTSLLILHDWSGSISFLDKEIDAERGVIHEEWRTRRSPDFRLRNQTTAALYNHSKYAKRDVIGDINVIDTCSYETMKRFYRDWYRPELQALIIIGDIDPKQIEQKIKKLFSSIPNPATIKPRFDIEIPNNTEPLIATATDPEAEQTRVQLLFKHDIVKDKNLNYYRNQIVNGLYSVMLNARFKELGRKENPPYVYAYNFYGDFVRSKAAYYSVALVKKGTSKEALSVLLTENQRVRQHGFTQAELDRAKKDLMAQYEKQFNEKDKTESGDFVWQYFSHFLTNEPAPGIEFEYNYAVKNIPEISLEELNGLANKYITDENIVVTITGPADSNIPSEAEISEILKNFKSLKTEAYTDDSLNEPLIGKIPKPKKAKTKTEKDGITELTYANGVKVIYKKTDFKADEILFEAVKFGGYSNVSDSEIESARMADQLVSVGGAGKFNLTQLQKKMSGKYLYVNPYINEFEHGIYGQSTPNDFETALQLIHLYFTAPREDAAAARTEIKKMESYYENKALNPASRFSDSISVIINSRNMRRAPMNKDFFPKVEYSEALAVYKNAYTDAFDMTFVFVGNIETESAEKLFATYLGTLPSKGQKGTYKNPKIYPPSGVLKKDIPFKLEVPKSTVYVNYSGKYEYTPQNNMELAMLEHIIDLRYIETIREEEGGTYGVHVYASKKLHPEPGYSIAIQFDCAPEKAEHLTTIVYQEIEKLKTEGPTDSDFKKTVEYLIKTREEELKENRFWLDALILYQTNGIKSYSSQIFDDILSKITKESIKNAANRHFDTENHIQIRMIPKE